MDGMFRILQNQATDVHYHAANLVWWVWIQKSRYRRDTAHCNGSYALCWTEKTLTRTVMEGPGAWNIRSHREADRNMVSKITNHT